MPRSPSLFSTGDLKLLGRFLPFLASRKRLVAANLASSACVSLSSIGIPLLVGRVVNDLDALTGQGTQPFPLMLHGGALVALFLLTASCNYCQVIFSSRLAEGFIYDLRNSAFAALLRQPMPFFDTRSSGDLASRLAKDTADIQSFFSEAAKQSFLSFLTVILALAAMLSISLRLTLLVACLLPLSIGFVQFYRHKLRTHAVDQSRLLGDITSQVHETVLHMPSIKAYGGENLELGRFAELCNSFRESGLSLSRTMASHAIANKVLVWATFTLALVAGYHEVVQGRLSTGELVAMLMLAFRISQPVLGMAYFASLSQKALSAALRLADILDAPPRSGPNPHGLNSPPDRNYLSFSDVSYQYGRSGGIRDVSFSLAAGSFNVLLGSSGAGKSTVLKLVLGLYTPASGYIRVNGETPGPVHGGSLRTHMAYVPQQPLLFNRSIAENIAYGRPDASMEAIVTAARLAELLDFIHALPQGFDTPAGEAGSLLSGGEKQRVALARAMLLDPDLLLLDEPLASLDPFTERNLMQTILQLATNRTTLLVTHDPEIALHADNILFFNGGRLEGIGSHDQLIQTIPNYASFTTISHPLSTGK